MGPRVRHRSWLFLRSMLGLRSGSDAAWSGSPAERAARGSVESPVTAAVLALAGYSVTVLASVLVLAFRCLGAERRAGEQKARGDCLDVNLTGLAAQLADMTNRHREEKERADHADDTVAQMLAEMAARPAAGSYAVLLQIIAAKHAERRDGSRAMPAPAGAHDGLDTELSRPGD